jgi:hypothetical protein
MPHRKVSDRLLCSIDASVDGAQQVDLGLFAEQLLLFDSVVLKSSQLIEIPRIAEAFGYRDTRELLESDTLGICDGPATIGETGHEPHAMFGRELDYGHFHLAGITLADHNQHKIDWLSRLQSIPGLSPKETSVIRSMVGSRVHPPPKDMYAPALASTQADVLSNNVLLRRAIVLNAEIKDLRFDSSELFASAKFEDGLYCITSNLRDISGLPMDACHKLVQGGLLAVANVNATIEDMSRNSAITAFREQDVPLFQQKLGLTVACRNNETRIADFSRVVRLGGLPSIREAVQNGTLDFRHLIQLRNTDECKEFRVWLRQTSERSDAEVKSVVSGFGVVASRILNNPAGAAISFLVPTLLGIVIDGPAGAIVGASLGVLDKFLLSRLLPERGPLTFIDNSYRSLFGS